jgi:hypothetical protein
MEGQFKDATLSPSPACRISRERLRKPVHLRCADDKVVVQSQSDNAATMQTADQGCGIYGRKAVGPLSYRCLDGYCINKAYLFACKEAPQYGTRQTLTVQ